MLNVKYKIYLKYSKENNYLDRPSQTLLSYVFLNNASVVQFLVA